MNQNLSENFPVVMTIAGSDSGGGAGIQADLKTFYSLNCFGTSAITAVTAQNTLGVHAIFPVATEVLAKQIEVVATDFDVKAAKTGMLHDARVIETVTQQVKAFHLDQHLVIDPVMVAKGGANLLQEDAKEALISLLLPLGTIITPNIPEAEAITGITIDNDIHRLEAAKALLAMGVKAAIIKGGHRYEGSDQAEDLYLDQTGTAFTLTTPRIDTPHTHGTGCTYSAALTSFLAQGFELSDAAIGAKAYIHAAIENTLGIGHGHGPTNHWAFGDNSVAYIERVQIHDISI